jgi:hypothetical protein
MSFIAHIPSFDSTLPTNLLQGGSTSVLPCSGPVTAAHYSAARSAARKMWGPTLRRPRVSCSNSEFWRES